MDKYQPEYWKPVKGFEGAYEISNHGRLKSFKSDPNGRILSNKNKTGWYLNVVLVDGNKMKSVKIHKLVATHFIPNPGDLPVVNHKDMNKQNNHVNNLEWVTYGENAKHAATCNPSYLTGMIRYNKFERPNTIQQFDLEGGFINEYQNGKEASTASGVCQRNILQVANKTEYKKGHYRKQAGGYIWRFKEVV